MKKRITLFDVVTATSVLFIVFATCCVITSCNMQNYQVNRMKLYAVKYPGPFAILSNQLVPCFSGIAKSDTNTIFLPGDTVFKAGKEMVVHQHDTTTIMQHDTLKITKSVVKTIHDTVTNDRAIASIQAQYTACTSDRDKGIAQLADAQKTISTMRWWLIGLLTAIVAFCAIKIYAFFAGGGITSIIKKVI